jgi:hypothetical protein
MIRPARRITEGSPKSFGMYERALALEAEGADLIHLEFGRPCHDTPAVIKDAAIAALRAGHVHYSDLRGQPALRRALAAKLRDYNGIVVEPDAVLVTNGLTHASYAAIMATIDPGDEVILLEPYYPNMSARSNWPADASCWHPWTPPTGSLSGRTLSLRASRPAHARSSSSTPPTRPAASTAAPNCKSSRHSRCDTT